MRKLSALLAAAILIWGLTLATSTPASATGAWLGCRVSPGTNTTWSQWCQSSQPASWYNAGFLVQNAPTPMSYTWSVPAGYSIYGYCGSSDNACAVVTHQGDYITVTVTLNYSDHSEIYSASADIELYCDTRFC
jgi:hypothetical protein